MKFFILGCNGMAGHAISLYLKEQYHDVVGFARAKSLLLDYTVVGDAFDTALLEATIGQGNFDVVVNCIGMLNQFAENDKAAAVFLNSYLPHFLVRVTKDMKTRIFHMSTDCVFSGKSGNYTETSLCDGETFYDRSKSLGEIDNEKDLTLRNSIIGPDINEKGIGLLNWFMKQEGNVNGFTKAIWTGQTTLQLAKTMEKAALQGATGLVNMVPNTNINKYELVKLFNHYLRQDKLTVSAIDGVNLDKTLVRTNFAFDYEIPDYDTQVREMAEWIYAHKELYPHYNL